MLHVSTSSISHCNENAKQAPATTFEAEELLQSIDCAQSHKLACQA